MTSQLESKGETLESFLSGKLSSVDVRKIEAELSKLWTQASVTSGEGHPQVIRACSGNLILYTDRDDAESTDANMLDAIVLAHPSRAILAICREADSPRLEAWVSARCHLDPATGSKQICSEQITVLSEGNLENELVSVIDSLLLGDLPSFLWWTCAELSGDKLASFLSCISRLIVDSSRSPFSFKYLRDLQQIAENMESCISISDLNWRRLLGLRAALAEEFERSPLSIKSLAEINKVKIISCGQQFQEDACSLQALLFVGWLSSRLSWDPVSLGKEPGKGVLARFRNKSQSIDVSFSTQELSHVAPGSIFELELQTESGQNIRISRDPSGEAGSLVVTVLQNGKKIRELLADDSDLDRVHLVGYELEDLSYDKIFYESLNAAYELIHLLED